MRNELTKHTFGACMIVLLLSFGLMLYVLNSYLVKRNFSELKDKALYVSEILNVEGEDVLSRVHHGGDMRITVVAPDGSVLYDSHVAPDTMENHLEREEIQQALSKGEGSSQHYSQSMFQNTANYAVRLQNGDILRVSIRQDTLWHLLRNLALPMLLFLLLAALVSIILAARASRRIVDPIDRMDVENPDDRDVYDELKPFVHRLITQNQQIHRQMEAIQAEHRKQDSLRREFTANVSHELKTPLTSISGFAEIIRDGMVKDEDIPHFADNIYKEAARLMELVNDILKLSHLEDINDRPDRERTSVELNALCREVTSRLAISAEKNGISIRCDGESVNVTGVRPMLEEIIYNVCDNAIKYNRKGGWVHISTHKQDGKAVVCVRDNGIGIPQADCGRVFERFYRVNKSHSKEVGGTGLGLSIVKHGMAFHAGQIKLQSVLGEGTEISLLLPAEE
ncbi:MAG: two-component sensor histidine kinase [Oscillospiraceae bacterium]|nr:two-component sensor histidine kinase [Oscillospiraceae bacterium]